MTALSAKPYLSGISAIPRKTPLPCVAAPAWSSRRWGHEKAARDSVHGTQAKPPPAVAGSRLAGLWGRDNRDIGKADKRTYGTRISGKRTAPGAWLHWLKQWRESAARTEAKRSKVAVPRVRCPGRILCAGAIRFLESFRSWWLVCSRTCSGRQAGQSSLKGFWRKPLTLCISRGRLW